MFGGMSGFTKETTPSAVYVCPKCDGLKKIGDVPCPTCNGEGVVFEKNVPKVGDSFTK